MTRYRMLTADLTFNCLKAAASLRSHYNTAHIASSSFSDNATRFQSYTIIQKTCLAGTTVFTKQPRTPYMSHYNIYTTYELVSFADNALKSREAFLEMRGELRLTREVGAIRFRLGRRCLHEEIENKQRAWAFVLICVLEKRNLQSPAFQ